jgi:hypothetical protein
VTGYYVTAVDGQRIALLVGPLQSHEAALARVKDAKRIAEAINSRALFYAYGTSRDKGGVTLPPGKLNEWFGLSSAVHR